MYEDRVMKQSYACLFRSLIVFNGLAARKMCIAILLKLWVGATRWTMSNFLMSPHSFHYYIFNTLDLMLQCYMTAFGETLQICNFNRLLY